MHAAQLDNEHGAAANNNAWLSVADIALFKEEEEAPAEL